MASKVEQDNADTPVYLMLISPIKITSRGDSNATYAIAMLELALHKAGVDYFLDITEGKLSSIRLLKGWITMLLM